MEVYYCQYLKIVGWLGGGEEAVQLVEAIHHKLGGSVFDSR